VHRAHVDRLGLARRLAHLQGVQDRELVRVLGHQVGPADQDVLAVHRRHAGPAPVLERGPRRGDRAVDVGGGRERDVGDDAAVDRADDLVPACTGDPGPVDEEIGRELHRGGQARPVRRDSSHERPPRHELINDTKGG
jgi:hypothetical protein